MAVGNNCCWPFIRTSLAAMFFILQLSACGDKEPEQRKTFIAFLQNTVMRADTTLPALSENQQHIIGNYTSDYAILYNFSQQTRNIIIKGINPVVDELMALRLPQDYLTHQNALRQLIPSLDRLGQQMQSAKSQADGTLARLKQPADVKNIYQAIYQKVVTKPAGILISLLSDLKLLDEYILQVSDYLLQQENAVSFKDNGVQFTSQQQADHYNNLMRQLSGKTQAFTQAQHMLHKEF